MTLQPLALNDQLINKILLKSQVTLPILSVVNTQKVAQRITTISPLSHKKQELSSKPVQLQPKRLSSQSKEGVIQQKWSMIKSKVGAGESAFNRKDYQLAVKEFNVALSGLSEAKSMEYYCVLRRKAECTKRMHKVQQLFKLYSELSLVIIGK